MEPELCKTLAPTNFAQYQATLKKLKGSTLAAMPIVCVDSTALLSWLASLEGATASRRNHVARVRAMLNRLGHKVTIELPKPPRKEKTTVWGHDSEEFMDWLRLQENNRRVAIGLLYMVGLRRSEACGLRFEDIVKGGAVLSVSVTETDDEVHVRAKMKTEDSSGFVAIPEELMGWIGKGKGFVLTGIKEPMKPRTLTQLVRRSLRLTKWVTVRPQALRRGFGQLVWERTGDAKLTAANMRHSLAMTDREYVQVDRGIKSRTIEEIFSKRDKKRDKRKTQ